MIRSESLFVWQQQPWRSLPANQRAGSRGGYEFSVGGKWFDLLKEVALRAGDRRAGSSYIRHHSEFLPWQRVEDQVGADEQDLERGRTGTIDAPHSRSNDLTWPHELLLRGP